MFSAPQAERRLNRVFTVDSGAVAYAGADGLGRSPRARRPAGAPGDPADADRGAGRRRVAWRRHRRQCHRLLVAAGVRVSAAARRRGHLALLPRRAARRGRHLPGRVVAGVWRPAEQLPAFEDVLAFRMAPLNVGEAGRTERQFGMLVSGNYFSELGLQPALGRFLAPTKSARPARAPVVVISYDFWQTRFAGATDAIGQTLRVNDRPLTVIGVTPRGIPGHGRRRQVRSLWCRRRWRRCCSRDRASSTSAGTAATR